MSDIKYRNNYGSNDSGYFSVRLNEFGQIIFPRRDTIDEEEQARIAWCNHMEEIAWELEQLEQMDLESDEADLETYYSHKREIEKARARSNK